jgi:hypothetical protein
MASFLVRYETTIVGSDSKVCYQNIVTNCPSLEAAIKFFWLIADYSTTELVGIQKVYSIPENVNIIAYRSTLIRSN